MSGDLRDGAAVSDLRVGEDGDTSHSAQKKTGRGSECFGGPWLDFVSEFLPDGSRRPGSLGLCFAYAWNELPQPQLFTALGLSNVNPRRSMPE
jgi:hypothetical protein